MNLKEMIVINNDVSVRPIFSTPIFHIKGIEVEVKSSTSTESTEEVVSKNTEETKTTSAKKITEKKEVKKSDNLK